jgi:hypothetical protein
LDADRLPQRPAMVNFTRQVWSCKHLQTATCMHSGTSPAQLSSTLPALT